MGKAAIPGLGGGVVPPEANITQRTHASLTCSEVIYNFDYILIYFCITNITQLLERTIMAGEKYGFEYNLYRWNIA